MSFQGALLALTVYLFLIGPAAAETGDWAAGQAAFAAGDYETALSHFESARDDGLEGTGRSLQHRRHPVQAGTLPPMPAKRFS